MPITRNNTTVVRRNGATVCTLHSTDIVTAYPDRIILNSGGWQTVTTKRRMNECFREWNLPLSVFQHSGKWIVTTPEGQISFTDGIEIKL